MGFIKNNQNSSKAVEKLKSFYSELLNKFTKLTELSTVMMHHSTKKNKQNVKEKVQLENSVSVFFKEKFFEVIFF